MRLGKYINDLLLENETIIIPGFGAFLSGYLPAVIDEKSGKINPPSKEISFSGKIRNNDGMLVGYIAETTGISHFDALKIIEKERENILYRLDKGEKVVFENVGVLFFDNNREICFESAESGNLLLDAFGMEPIPIPEKMPENETQEREQEEVHVTAIVNDWKKTKKPVEEKKKTWWWYLLILIPLLIASIIVINNKQQLLEESSSETTDDSVSDANKDQLVVIDSTQQDTTQFFAGDSVLSENIEIDSVKIEPETPGFILVGGSFKEEENAEKYVQQLKEEGYDAFPWGKRGNFFLVGIGKYDAEDEAIAAKNLFMDKNPNSGVWIYEEYGN